MSGFFGDLFARGDWWWTLLAVPLAIGAYVWGARVRRRTFAALGNPTLVSRLVATVNPGARLLRAGLAIAGLAGIAVALMRPQHGGKAKVVPSEGLDIVVAVDYSKSMLVDDIYPSRIERLEAELARFLDEAGNRGDRVGVVVFAGAARGLPVTNDMRLLQLYLERANPLSERPGGTAIGKALDLGIQFLVEARAEGKLPEGEDLPEGVPEEPRAQADQVIILLTDGEDTASRPLEVAKRAAELGIRVYTVGIGSKTGQPVPQFDEAGRAVEWVRDDQGNVVVTRLDEDTLRSIAKMTAGEYVRVTPEQFGLDAVSEKLVDLARAQREHELKIEREEGYHFALVPALVCLVLALGIGDRRKRRAA